MKRLLVVLTLLAGLVLGFAAVAEASPVKQADGFEWFVDYGPGAYADSNDYYFGVGVGYSVTEDITLGLELQADGSDLFLGAYTNMQFGQILVNGDFFFDYASQLCFKLAGLYAFDLKPFMVAVGGGYMQGPDSFFLEASAVYDPCDCRAIYASLDYDLKYDEFLFKVGLSFAYN